MKSGFLLKKKKMKKKPRQRGKAGAPCAAEPQTGAKVLLLGPPGVGKNSLLRGESTICPSRGRGSGLGPPEQRVDTRARPPVVSHAWQGCFNSSMRTGLSCRSPAVSCRQTREERQRATDKGDREPGGEPMRKSASVLSGQGGG